MTSHDPFSSSLPAPAETPELSDETLSRCARLLATGEIDWPTGLSAEQQLALMAEVRRCRRARLVKFIASLIAADIAREGGGRAEALP